MLDHIGLNVSDYPRSRDFYAQALAPLGLALVMEPIPRTGGFGTDGKPWFWISGVRMPVTENMPYSWYDTPNIHFCTIRDFVELCRVVGAQMEKAVALNAGGQPMRVTLPWWVWNLLGDQGVFLLKRR